MTAHKHRVVVVGNGMVGHRVCQSLTDHPERATLEIVALGEEPRPAYDRVHLSEYFSGRSADDLLLADAGWYAERGIELVLSDSAVAIDRDARKVTTRSGRVLEYDDLVLATGSAPFVPPLPGVASPRVFVYRTIEDLERIDALANQSRTAAVIGGGLLGLEAAKALVDKGLATTVVEAAPRLMPRQVDATGGALLLRLIERLGVKIICSARTSEIADTGEGVEIRFADREPLAIDMIVVSAGVRPRDELAGPAGLARGERGGIAVGDDLRTSDPHIFAIGECAAHRNFVYGLVAPGYAMADRVAAAIFGEASPFEGADLSTKLKLLGVDVGSFGNPFADEIAPTPAGSMSTRNVQTIVYEDAYRGVYQKLLVSNEDRRLIGGILVGDCEPYATLLALTQRGKPLEVEPHELLFGKGEAIDLGEEAQLCSCNDVSYGDVRKAIRAQELATVGGIKACTRAGTGCGGCVPVLTRVLEQELLAAGREVDRNLCEHFPFARPELFQIVKVSRAKSFDAVLASHGRGNGCEVCRPAVASILATTWADPILNHQSIQDTNDRFLANMQRRGLYSIVPRVAGGEITADKLIVLGQVAKKHNLYCKITGGQRIDLFGARVDQLPEIWEELVAAGFESGHAYGKALRTVKSCVGTSWCRFGVQDSTSFAIRIEERYRGMRSPHKLKSAVSGCIRECAEAQSKDFGFIATEDGWNIYVCGNGGSRPRHADLLATGVSDDEAIRLIDRFLMYYIHTANPLERTAPWLDRLDGGIEYLKSVVIGDVLGIAADLERDMAKLVDSYQCEWKEVVENPERRALFRHFANSEETDDEIELIEERTQIRPGDWSESGHELRREGGTAEEDWTWKRVGGLDTLPKDAGLAFRVDGGQLAIFHVASEDRYYASENRCPHKKDMVLSRGLLGTQGDEPKVACPLHKKSFSLRTGKGLSDPAYNIRTFPVEVRADGIFVKLPPASEWVTKRENVAKGHGCGGGGARTGGGCVGGSALASAGCGGGMG